MNAKEMDNLIQKEHHISRLQANLLFMSSDATNGVKLLDGLIQKYPNMCADCFEKMIELKKLFRSITELAKCK